MDEKEKLEKELKFLKETYEAGIITKEEYEKGEKRIEERLNEPREDIRIEEIPKEELEKKEMEEFAKEITNNRHEEGEEEPTEAEEIEEKRPEEETTQEYIEKEKEEKEEEPELEPIGEKQPVKINKKIILTLSILIVLALILVFFLKTNPISAPQEEKKATLNPICSVDADCQKEGQIGSCISPNTKKSRCEFRYDAPVSLTVIDGCLLCSTSEKIKTIKQQLFPGAKETIIDHSSNEGKELIASLGIEALPAFIFGQDITQAYNFNKTKNSFIKKGDSYIWSPVLSSNYYFKRKEIVNRLDLYTIAGDKEIKAEENLKEVLGLFGDKINFEKHIAEEGQKKALEKELGIKTYPAFLINNQLRFSGILPAETVKEKFCKFNQLDECSTTLSADIK